MSFGFSVGDFLAAGATIKNIVDALRGEATFEYRELELELHGLQRALTEIEHLRSGNGQDEAALNAVKVAALMCHYPLEEFRSKLSRYQVLSSQGGTPTRLDKLKGWGRKAQWNLCTEDEVQKLRAYIAGHTASLNMRLLTLGVSTLSTVKVEAAEQLRLLQIGQSEQTGAIQASTSRVGSLYELVATQALPRLDSLVDMVRKVWDSNMKIVNYLSSLQSASLTIDTKHTFFQQPMRLEDAYGRILPIPAEYGWSTMQAVITDRFSSGPGSEKILAGEYELFLTRDSSELLTERTTSLLQPGSAITMAVVIGMYENVPQDRCPRTGCLSSKLSKHTAGGWVCDTCMAWFGKSKSASPRPFRMLGPDHGIADRSSPPAARSRKRKGRGVCEPATTILDKLRSDRKWFKNLRIHFVGWPWDLDIASDKEEAPPRKRVRMEGENSSGDPDAPEPSAMPDPVKSPPDQQGTTSSHEPFCEAEVHRDGFAESLFQALQVVLKDVFTLDPKWEHTDSTNLFGLGMDSFTAMYISYFLTEKLGIMNMKVTVEMILKNPVVGDLKKLITAQLAQ